MKGVMMKGVVLVLLEGLLGRKTLAAGAGPAVPCGFQVLDQRLLRRETLAAGAVAL